MVRLPADRRDGPIPRPLHDGAAIDLAADRSVRREARRLARRRAVRATRRATAALARATSVGVKRRPLCQQLRRESRCDRPSVWVIARHRAAGWRRRARPSRRRRPTPPESINGSRSSSSLSLPSVNRCEPWRKSSNVHIVGRDPLRAAQAECVAQGDDVDPQQAAHGLGGPPREWVVEMSIFGQQDARQCIGIDGQALAERPQQHLEAKLTKRQRQHMDRIVGAAARRAPDPGSTGPSSEDESVWGVGVRGVAGCVAGGGRAHDPSMRKGCDSLRVRPITTRCGHPAGVDHTT